MKHILFYLSAIICPIAVYGQESPIVFKTDNLYFWVHSPGEAAVVNPLAIIGNEEIYEGDVIIPATVAHDGIDYSVTAIAKQAFENYEITSVTIPATVGTIGENAFAGCGSLAAVNITDLGAWCGIDFNNSYSSPLFYARHLFLNGTEVENLVIPSSVDAIGEYTFKKCLSITSVDFGTGVTSIAPNAFYGCDNLTSVTLHDNVTRLGESAFWSCASLSSVNGGDGLLEVGRRPFEYTPWETSQPEGAVYLGEHVLYMFKGTPASTSFAIPSNIKVIAGDAFYNCKALTSVSFPESVEWIGPYAFHECSGIETVTLRKVKYLGNNAFFRCTGIKGADLGTALSRVEESTFAGCTSLRSIKIPDAATSIGASAFRECTSLRTATIGEGVTTVGTAAFTGCSALRKITLPDNVTTVEASAFAGCTNLSSVSISAGVESIGYSAFYDCSNLSEIIIADYETPLQLSYNSRPYGKPEGEGLFQAGNLIEVYIGRDLTFDSSAACGYTPFNNQTFLENVTFGATVTQVQPDLFRGCDGIYSISVDAVTPPAAPSTAPYPFTESTFSRATLSVPEGSVGSYAQAPCWREFNKITGTSSGITEADMSNKSVTPFAISGRTVTATGNGYVQVYMPDGRPVSAKTATTVNLPCSGVYIVVAAEKAYKVSVR